MWSNCVNCKQTRNLFSKSHSKTTDVLQLVHTDVCGKFQTSSKGGATYFVTFIDDFSRFTWVYPLKSKDEVFKVFCDWKIMVENLTGKLLKRIRSDNGGEYKSNKFSAFTKHHGIIHEFTVRKTPEQNGMAERLNRTLVERIRCMLSDSSLPKSFWAEALNTATYLKNRSPCCNVEKTPYETLYGKKPNVSKFRI